MVGGREVGGPGGLVRCGVASPRLDPSTVALTLLALVAFASNSHLTRLALGLMAVAGVAWAAYTIMGRSLPDPIAANARSFVLACPIAALAWLVAGTSATASTRGIALAVVSGGVTSGLGDACWYRVLPR